MVKWLVEFLPYDFEARLLDVMARLPEWRRRKALSYRHDRDRYLCASAYLLLADMLKDAFGIVDVGEFGYGPNGKPYLVEHPKVHFNLSHCSLGVACAVGDVPVGVDIETCTFDRDTARRVLNDTEFTQVEGAVDSALEFARLWTKKESCLKLYGIGIVADIRNVLKLADGEVHIQTTDHPKPCVSSCAIRR